MREVFGLAAAAVILVAGLSGCFSSHGRTGDSDETEPGGVDGASGVPADQNAKPESTLPSYCRTGDDGVIVGHVDVDNDDPRGDLFRLKGATVITGDLSIGGIEPQGTLSIGGPDNTSLNGLECLQEVGGVAIINNPLLENLKGLEGLRYVPGGVTISHNEKLVNLQGLDNLNEIGGDLLIEDNNALDNLGGLESLSSIDGSLIITDNNALENLDALSGLEEIGGDLSIRNNETLSLCESTALRDQLGTENIPGAIYVYQNAWGPCL